MKIVTPPLEIEENDGFKNDALERRPFGEALRNIVLNSSDELVISLDGRWGEGKTTFVKMWQGLLNESNIHNIYINAFETDYVDDPFIAVASAITDHIDEKIPKDATTEYVEKAKNVGVRFLSWSARVGIKIATIGAIKDSDFDELDDIRKDIAKDVSSVVGNFIEERLTSHKEDIQAIESFKELLSNLPDQLSKNESEEETIKPLVIIIDELDRCKPTYALEMIEKIKHLFSVKNVIFVLVLNKVQMKESIKCIYGLKIDANEYLQKFINVETTIPKNLKDLEKYNNEIKLYCDELKRRHELKGLLKDNELIGCIEFYSNHFNLSLRELERVFTNICIFISSSGFNSNILNPVISLVAVIKVKDIQLFEDIKQNRVSEQELINRTRLNKNSEFNTNSYFQNHISLCFVDINSLRNDEEPNPVLNLYFQYSINRYENRRILQKYSHNMSMFNVS